MLIIRQCRKKLSFWVGLEVQIILYNVCEVPNKCYVKTTAGTFFHIPSDWLLVFISREKQRVVHFHLSLYITLKDVGSQHGRIRGFTQEPTVVEVSLDLQEDEISTKITRDL